MAKRSRWSEKGQGKPGQNQNRRRKRRHQKLASWFYFWNYRSATFRTTRPVLTVREKSISQQNRRFFTSARSSTFGTAIYIYKGMGEAGHNIVLQTSGHRQTKIGEFDFGQMPVGTAP